MFMPKILVQLLFSSCFKLSHYLDIVEVQIAQQVAQKSEAFFIAMTSHDALMEQLTQTINVVKALR
jgi:vacuolar protein sorting-associated protein 54